MATATAKGQTQAERIEAGRAAMSEAQAKHRTYSKGYDPGTPGRVECDGGTRYRVESFRDSDHWYIVDVKTGTCSCNDYLYRHPEGGCKHFRHAVEFERSERRSAAWLKALSLPAEELQKHLSRRDLAPEVREGIALAARFKAEQERIKRLGYARV